MRNKYCFVLVMLICISLVCAGFTAAYVAGENDTSNDGGITIVTSFYPMYIATLNVVDGVDGIHLENLSEPQTGCLHDFQLTPEDMKLLSKADVFVINGGGIESFMTDVATAYPKLAIVEACEGLELISEDGEDDEVHDEHGEDGHDHGDVNAHAWMSVKLYRKQVANIANYLSQIDPSNAKKYQENAQNYDGELAKLQDKQQKAINFSNNQNIVIFHEAFAYVAEDYGINVCAVMDLDEERQISAGEVAGIISTIEQNSVSYILAEETYGADMGRVIEAETDATVVYIDPLNRGDYDKDSYLNGMDANIDKLTEAFSGKE
ncbi:MAG: metal ABC transporter substrate-binding protein [Agathobacter sp.]|nr:metal ABC transporter substrate-binding protein [Agathobacter sp.]MDY3795462.1 metal ABC transporter substrate-binding protein [Agathobacter sp.]